MRGRAWLLILALAGLLAYAAILSQALPVVADDWLDRDSSCVRSTVGNQRP